MRKIYFLICWALCLANLSFSQDTTSYYGKSQYIFEHVDKSQIASGVLKEYGIKINIIFQQ